MNKEAIQQYVDTIIKEAAEDGTGLPDKNVVRATLMTKYELKQHEADLIMAAIIVSVMQRSGTNQYEKMTKCLIEAGMDIGMAPVEGIDMCIQWTTKLFSKEVNGIDRKETECVLNILHAIKSARELLAPVVEAYEKHSKTLQELQKDKVNQSIQSPLRPPKGSVSGHSLS